MAPQAGIHNTEEDTTSTENLKNLDDVELSEGAKNALLELEQKTEEEKKGVFALGLGIDPVRSVRIAEVIYAKLESLNEDFREGKTPEGINTSKVFLLLLEYDLTRNELIYAGSMAEEIIQKHMNPVSGILNQLLG